MGLMKSGIKKVNRKFVLVGGAVGGGVRGNPTDSATALTDE